MPLKGKKGVFAAMDKLYDDAGETIKAAGIAVFSGVITGTPVDTGRARGNWFLTEGAPSSRRTRLTNRDSQKQLKDFQNAKLSNQSWFLTNNLPYIEFLEYESKHKGWVRGNIERVRIQIKRGRL